MPAITMTVKHLDNSLDTAKKFLCDPSDGGSNAHFVAFHPVKLAAAGAAVAPARTTMLTSWSIEDGKPKLSSPGRTNAGSDGSLSTATASHEELLWLPSQCGRTSSS